MTERTREYLSLSFRPVTPADALAILGWRYAAPYERYTMTDAAAVPRAGMIALSDPANNYFAARNPAGEIVGFCCFGADARVLGGDYRDADALDVGLGLRPDYTGRGLGTAFVEQVLALGRASFAPQRFRLTVAAFNARAITVYERCGFQLQSRFHRGGVPGGDEFVVLTRDG